MKTLFIASNPVEAPGLNVGAALSVIRTPYQTTVGLDRSAGVYRSGLVASGVAYRKTQFDPVKDTTWDALDCLGLSHDKLARPAYSLVQQSADPAVHERPFAALMLIAQTSCALLPLTTHGTIPDEVVRRNAVCGRIKFVPASRPTQVQLAAGQITPPTQSSEEKATPVKQSQP